MDQQGQTDAPLRVERIEQQLGGDVRALQCRLRNAGHHKDREQQGHHFGTGIDTGAETVTQNNRGSKNDQQTQTGRQQYESTEFFYAFSVALATDMQGSFQLMTSPSGPRSHKQAGVAAFLAGLILQRVLLPDMY